MLTIAAFLWSSSALADGLTVFTDEASFEAGLPVTGCGPTTLDFEELAYSEVLADQYKSLGVRFTGLEPPEIDDSIGANPVACADTRCPRVPTDTYWEGDGMPDYLTVRFSPPTRALSLRLIALGQGDDGDEEAATITASVEGATVATESYVPGSSTVDGGVWVGLVFDTWVDTVTITAEEPGDMIGFDDVWWLSGECEDWDGDGVSAAQGDCDDQDNTVSPGAPELCDGLDNDCNEQLDHSEGDADYDGQMDCLDTDNDGFSTWDGDCDPWDDRIYPEATDDATACDGLDNNCDGLDPWDADADYDGQVDCLDTDGDGISTWDGDCDPWDAVVHPGQNEICDGVDDDCDGVVPDNELDSDGDGFLTCAGDCDDRDFLIHPFAAEDDNGVDSNCDHRVSGGQIGCASASGRAGLMLAALSLCVTLSRRGRSMARGAR